MEPQQPRGPPPSHLVKKAAEPPSHLVKKAAEPQQPRGPPPSHLVKKEAPPVVPSRLDRKKFVARPPRMKPPRMRAPPRRVARPPVAPSGAVAPVLPRQAPSLAANPPVAPPPRVLLPRQQRDRYDAEFAAPSLDENAELSAAPAAAAAVAEEGAAAVTEEGAAAVTEEGAAATEEGGDAEEGAAAVTEEVPTPPPPALEVRPRKRPRAEMEAEGASAAYRFPRARGEGWDAEAAALVPPSDGVGTEWEMAPWWPDIEWHHRRYMQSLVLAFQYWVEARATHHAFAAEMRRLGLDGYLAAANASYDQAWEDWTEQVQFEVADDGGVDWSWRPGSRCDVALRQ